MKYSEMQEENKQVIVRIVEQCLQRLGVFAKIQVTTKEIRGKEYVEVRSEPFQTSPVIYRKVFVYGSGTIVQDSKDEGVYHLSISLSYGFKYFSGSENGVDIGNVMMKILRNKETDREWVLFGGVYFDINTSPYYIEDED